MIFKFKEKSYCFGTDEFARMLENGGEIYV